jgi:hypothetical protein
MSHTHRYDFFENKQFTNQLWRDFRTITSKLRGYDFPNRLTVVVSDRVEIVMNYCLNCKVYFDYQ